jgi:hypothetical protein
MLSTFLRRPPEVAFAAGFHRGLRRPTGIHAAGRARSDLCPLTEMVELVSRVMLT